MVRYQVSTYNTYTKEKHVRFIVQEERLTTVIKELLEEIRQWAFTYVVVEEKEY